MRCWFLLLYLHIYYMSKYVTLRAVTSSSFSGWFDCAAGCMMLDSMADNISDRKSMSALLSACCAETRKRQGLPSSLRLFKTATLQRCEWYTLRNERGLTSVHVNVIVGERSPTLIKFCYSSNCSETKVVLTAHILLLMRNNSIPYYVCPVVNCLLLVPLETGCSLYVQ